MNKLQVLLAQKLATRLEAVLEAQLDAALDAALDMALDRLLGTDTQPQAKAKTKASKKPQAEQPAEQPQAQAVRVRAQAPTRPTSYEEFTDMLVAAGLGQSKSGKDLAALWANRASALRKHYEEKGTPVPWQRLWAMVGQDKHLPTRAEGNARAIAQALGLPTA